MRAHGVELNAASCAGTPLPPPPARSYYGFKRSNTSSALLSSLHVAPYVSYERGTHVTRNSAMQRRVQARPPRPPLRAPSLGFRG